MDSRLFTKSLCKAFNQILEPWMREFPVVSLSEYISTADRIADGAPAAAEFVGKHLSVCDRIIYSPLEQIIQFLWISDCIPEDHLYRPDKGCVCERSCYRHRNAHFRESHLEVDSPLEDRKEYRILFRVILHQFRKHGIVCKYRLDHAIDTDFREIYLRADSLCHRSQSESRCESADIELFLSSLNYINVNFNIIPPLRSCIAEDICHGLFITLQ